MATCVYDVNASLPVLLDDGTRKYVWGLGLAFAVDASGSPIVYHTDGLGSVRALTDASGTLVQTYQYDEYGDVLSFSGSITQPFQYTGEVRDDYTKFVYLRARYLDPETGRFLSRDDFGGIPAVPASLHRYSYVLNNPMVAADPSGRCPSGFSQYTPIAAGPVLASSPTVAEAVVACFASPPCIIAAGTAYAGYYWWTHGGQEATAQAVNDLSIWFANRIEKGKVKYYTRDMTPEQKERFQREVEDRKFSKGAGGAYKQKNIDEVMKDIRGGILEGRY